MNSCNEGNGFHSLATPLQFTERSFGAGRRSAFLLTISPGNIMNRFYNIIGITLLKTHLWDDQKGKATLTPIISCFQISMTSSFAARVQVPTVDPKCIPPAES
ncbi:Uncharacterised protein [uncultured archaeon]|nr:Uncharacterised protein [uncultured archaeon]